MKKLLIISLISICSIAHAEDNEITPFPNLKLHDGINIVKMSEVRLPGDVTNDDDRSMKLKGYVETHDLDNNINALFMIKNDARNELKSYDNESNPQDTHLRSSYKKIPLSFNYYGLPKIDGKVIGYAAAGGYSHDKGWDGIVGFFEDKNLGLCSYTTFAIKKVILTSEKIEYLVANKASIKSIQGNYKSGFLYSLSWYESNRLYSIECANKKFDRQLIDSIVTFANKLDMHKIN